ncbi:MAG: UDP-3-O-acyl-N-acetylglucosamine deacetylase [Acidobacteriota bacterium]
MVYRTTVARPITVTGIGLHTGRKVRMTLAPASPGQGVVFRRLDLGGRPIPAVPETLSSATYATTLATDGASVSTVEHLLSAVLGLGIDDLLVDLDGGEVPILDGSAAPFVALLEQAGRAVSSRPRQVIRIERPLRVMDGNRSLLLEPHLRFSITYSIDFDGTFIGHSRGRFTLGEGDYARDIAPARTFCCLDEVEALRQAGLAQGGSLRNALVVDGKDLLNGPLRFADEFVRHKIRDLMGDLALLGRPIQGRITVLRGGHALHGRLVKTLMERPEAWSLQPVRRPTVKVGRPPMAASA